MQYRVLPGRMGLVSRLASLLNWNDSHGAYSSIAPVGRWACSCRRRAGEHDVTDHEILWHVGPAWLMAVELLCLTHYFICDWLRERETSLP